jgi:hypothetical protein
MSTLADDFSRFAIAERELSEGAGPVLATIVERLQIRLGVRITQMHVTFDRDSNGSLVANCTLADADASRGGRGNGDRGGTDPQSRSQET